MSFTDHATDEENASPERESFVVTDLPRVPNIATILDEQTLGDIAGKTWDEYQIDKNSRAEKEKEWEESAKAFELKREPKSYPFEHAANVKFPILNQSVIQFAARAMPALTPNGKIAKGKVIGPDPDGGKAERGDRTANYLNYQLLERDDTWLTETDTMLHQMAVYGDGIKKLYHDPSRGNVSETVCIRDFVVNASYPSLDRAPRYTQCFELYPNEIEERKRDGRYIEFEATTPEGGDEDGRKDETTDIYADTSAAHQFIEQHRRLDLDDDGYEEPYIVTLHCPSRKVVRIVACFDEMDIALDDAGGVKKIGRKDYFIRYQFLPDPNGGFYSVGLGALLMDSTAAINSVINQIIDAGTLQNAGGGFIGKEFRLKAGEARFSPGIFKQVTVAGDDLRKAIYHMQHPGPSAVLFEMLGFLVTMAKELSSTSDVLQGDVKTNQPATTTLALIEQGLKVFTGVMARTLRALGAELKALYTLNARYGDAGEYSAVCDVPPELMAQDFGLDSADIVPVADAATATDMQKAAKAQVLVPFMGLEGGQPDPMVNQLEARRRYFEAAGIAMEGLLEQPQPDPAQVAAVEADVAQKQAGVEKTKAETVKLLTEASIAEAKVGLEAEKVAQADEQGRMKAASDVMNAGIKREGQQQKVSNDAARADGGRVPGMEGASGDAGVSPSPDELLALLGGGGQGGDVAGGMPVPGTAMPIGAEEGAIPLGGGGRESGF